MENLYTVQKKYEALSGPVQESDQTRIFENEYARQMYYAGLTKASVQSAIHWLEKPENAGVADNKKMCSVLKEKLKNISQIQDQVRKELRKAPFVINALIPKGEEVPQVTNPVSVPVSAPTLQATVTPLKTITSPVGIPEEITMDFSKEQRESEKILMTLENTNIEQNIIVSKDKKKAWKGDILNPNIAKMKGNTHTTIWGEIIDGKRVIYVLNNQNNKLDAVFSLDNKNQITDKKISNPDLNIGTIPFIPTIHVQLEKHK